MSKSTDAGRAIAIGFGCAITAFCIGGMIFMLKVLISPWWIPLIIAVVIGTALALPMPRPMEMDDKKRQHRPQPYLPPAFHNSVSYLCRFVYKLCYIR